MAQFPAQFPDRLLARLNRPVDIAWLAAFRVLFGLTMAFSTARFLVHDWPMKLSAETPFHFKYWGFAWIPTPNDSSLAAILILVTLLALAVAAGLAFRVTAPLFALGFAYCQLLDVAGYLNHYYLAALLAFLLALSPAHRAHSLDAFWSRRSVREVRTAWLWLFRLQIGVVYTFAGLAKFQGDWLLHAQPLGIWLTSRTDVPVLGRLFAEPWAAPLMSWAGFLFDTTIVWWLLWHRSRPWAYAAVIVFHTLTSVLFPIGMFPVIMTVSALFFFSPSWPRKLRACMASLRSTVLVPAASDADLAAAGTCTPRWSRLATVAALAYACVQIALPLRHLAYSGNVLWDEQGMRFSWRVMVREKGGSITYRVRSKATGRIWEANPRAYLSRRQESEMSGQPDLILQLAHRIRDDFEAHGVGPVAVHADAKASLNGRPAAPLIDPSVDLAEIRDGVLPARYILPAPVGPPPAIRSVAR